MIHETKTNLGERRVVVQEREFGFHTIEVGILRIPSISILERNGTLTNIKLTPILSAPVLGFAWPGFAAQFQSLN